MRRSSGRRAGRERAWLAGACLGALLGAPPAAAAADFGPAPSSRLRAGSTETVRLDAASPGVDERELILSLDGGRTFPVRLTGEIGPGDGSASWRVPALPTEHAVLALREGGDGLDERIVSTGAEFSIVPGPCVSVETLRFRDGEWKTREADEGHSALPTSSFGSAGQDHLSPLLDGEVALEAPVRGIPDGPEGLAAPEHGPTIAPPPDVTGLRPRVIRFLPLRE